MLQKIHTVQNNKEIIHKLQADLTDATILSDTDKNYMYCTQMNGCYDSKSRKPVIFDYDNIKKDYCIRLKDELVDTNGNDNNYAQINDQGHIEFKTHADGCTHFTMDTIENNHPVLHSSLKVSLHQPDSSATIGASTIGASTIGASTIGASNVCYFDKVVHDTGGLSMKCVKDRSIVIGKNNVP